MPQSANNDLVSALTGLVGIATIPIVIALIIFCLWLYFGIGTLTRLTDIKYLLDDIKNALENDNANDVSSEATREMSANISAATELEVAIEETPSVAVKVGTALKGLKKPSKIFIWLLGIIAVIFVTLIVIAYLINN